MRRSTKFLTVLLALSFVGGTWLALGPGAAAEGTRESPNAVATPRHEDAVSYVLNVTEEGKSPRFFEMTFRWVGPRTDRDAFGVATTGDLLVGTVRSLDSNAAEQPFRLVFRPGSIEPFAVDVTSLTTVTGTQRTLLVLDVPYTHTVLGQYRTYAWWGPLQCLARAGWQGATLDHVPRAYAEVCPEPRTRGPFVTVTGPSWRDATLDAVGWEEVPAGSAYRFTAGAFDLKLGRERHDWWLAPGVAYPAQAVFESEVAGRRVVTTAVLTGLENGDLPLLDPASAIPAPARRANAEFGYLGNDGPADGDGEAIVFPLSRAVAVAYEDPRPARFHSWREAHPDARLIAARYDDRSGVARGDALPAQSARTWTLTWADPAGGPSRTVHVTERSEASIVPGTPSAYFVSDGAQTRHPPFDAAKLPAKVLTLEAAVTLWRIEQPASLHRSLTFLEARWSPDEITYTLGYQRTGAQVAGPAIDHGLEQAQITVDGATGGVSYGFVRDSDHRSEVAPSRIILPMAKVSRSKVAKPSSPDVPEPFALAAAAAAGLTLLALLANGLGALLARGLLAPLYTRLAKGDVLDNGARAQILDAIRDQPGIHTSELLRRVPCGNGALTYHLEVLHRTNHVTRVDAGRYIRWFATGTIPHGEMTRRSALLAGSSQALFDLVKEEPGLSQRELARRLGLTPSAIHAGLTRLERKGLVEKRRFGVATGVFACEA